jgi:hypothetical protein
MRVQEAEKYLRWVFSKYKRIPVTPKLVEATECLLKAAAYATNDEIGFRSFCRLWLSQIIHYKTVPWDPIVQKELARNLMMPTSRVMFGLSESLGDLGVDRYFEGKSTITLNDLKRKDEIRNIYTPEYLEKNLRPMYSQLKLVNDDI